MFSKNNYIVNLKNLKNNAKIIRRVVGNRVKICAVVKANAYGMGMCAISSALVDDVEFFGVASVCEAVSFREYNKKSKVLILGEVNLDAIQWCAENNVSVAVSSLEELQYIDKNLNGQLLKIHLKVNTGLNRIGFDSIIKFNKAVSIVKKSYVMSLEGVFTHFATKANDIKFIEKQHEILEKYIKNIPNDVIVHCCNSFATLNDKRYLHNMVRTGFALYGEHECNYKLQSVLSITSSIIHIHRVKKNETVGYDRTFRAKQDMNVAIVPVGYADGLDRRLSNNFYLLVNGKRAPIVGNICMDVVMLDVTNISQVYVGSKVTLIGLDGVEKLTPQDYATKLQTSAYEILLKFNYKRMNYVVINE